MKYPWLDDYLLSKKSAEKEFKIEWNATRYLLKNKMFCLIGEDQSGKTVITLKCEPQNAEKLRGEFDDIIPGYYMNKVHWNSVYLEGNVPDRVLKEMIDSSYQLVFNSLTKKLQQEIKQ